MEDEETETERRKVRRRNEVLQMNHEGQEESSEVGHLQGP